MNNREYKDALFKFLFGSQERKEWTLSLYNAVNNSNYTNVDDLTIVTLEDVLYIGMKNDVSFLFHNSINLYEQQSSFNPNMPFRMLEYYVEQTNRYIKENQMSVYGPKLMKLPTPNFVVFYNGEYKSNIKEFKLSDMYECTDGNIELLVKVYNINEDGDKSLLDKCFILDSYSKIVENIRKLKIAGLTIEKAIDKALDEMPNNEVKDLLILEKKEVTTMLKTEYNEEEFKKEYGTAMKNIGKEEGREEALNETVLKLKNYGLDDISIASIVNYSLDEVEKIIKEDSLL